MDTVSEFILRYDAYIRKKSLILARDDAEADELRQKGSIILWRHHGRLAKTRDAAVKAFLAKSMRIRVLISTAAKNAYMMPIRSIICFNSL